MNEADIVIIGGGPGGYTAAAHAARLGAKVTLVEKDRLGGTCLNRGCIPTKALTQSVQMFRDARRADEFGIRSEGVTANFPKIMEHKNQVVADLASGVSELMRLNRINVLSGTGRIISPNQVQVNSEIIAAKRLIIATGSSPSLPPIPGRDLPGVIDTDGILELKELPKSLVIIGGGYVGAEFASIFGGLGTRVSIVEMLPRCLITVDESICRLFTQEMQRQGIQVRTGATVKAIRQNGSLLEVAWDTPEGEQAVSGQFVLVATGRVPYTEGLGLAEIGLKMEKRAIAVNEYLETSIPGIYAIGDVTGRYMLAHVAYYEAEVAAENALGRPRKTDYSTVPACIFTQPEIACVGITEEEAKKTSLPYKTSRSYFAANGRAVTMGETTGMVKMLCQAENGTVLGVHIIGPHASELIAEAALAIKMGAKAQDIAHTIHVHPTLSEALREASSGQLTGPTRIRGN